MSTNTDDYLRALAAEYERGLNEAPAPTSGNTVKPSPELMRALDSLAAPAPISGNEAVSELSHDNKGDVTSGNDEMEATLAELAAVGKEMDALGYDRDIFAETAALIRKLAKPVTNDEVEAMCARVPLLVAACHESVRSDCIAIADQIVTMIRKQAAEIAEMERVGHDLINQMFQLKADGAQYQKDAERYREARHNADFKVEYSNGISEWVELEDEKLDAAIDAAIAKEGKPTQTADSETVAHPETE